MMDSQTQTLFNQITAKPVEELTKDELDFLKARRLYLTPAQRNAYASADVELFKNKTEAKVVLTNEPVFVEEIEVMVEDAETDVPEAKEPETPVEEEPVVKKDKK